MAFRFGDQLDVTDAPDEALGKRLPGTTAVSPAGLLQNQGNCSLQWRKEQSAVEACSAKRRKSGSKE